MAKIFMPELDHDQRITIMRENADKIEDKEYYKPLTEAEVAERCRDLTDNSIVLSDLEAEKKELVAGIKAQIDPLKEKNKQLITEIKSRQMLVDGNLFLMADHEEGMMETYDEHGELVASRRLLPEEKQGRVPFLKKVADQ